MTDKELLELAAKAAGLEFYPVYSDQEFLGYMTSPGSWPGGWFDPLTDDGDALRLAVKLNIEFDNAGGFCTAHQYDYDIDCDEPHSNDPYEATRRAIVRAAAEIGKGME